MLATSAAVWALLGQAVATTGGNTEAGVNAFREGRFAEARTSLEGALARDSNDNTARAFLAMTKAAGHDCADAAGTFEQERDDTLARMAGLAAVECNVASEKQDEAFALLRKVEARFPADPDVLYESAKLHRKAWDRAVRAMYEKTPASYRVNEISAEVFESEGKYGEAAAQYRAAITKAPAALNLHYRLGRCLLLDSTTAENLRNANVEFEAELKLNPSDAVAVYQVGQILSASGKQEEALRRYQQALTLHPDFPEALLAIGKILAKDKQFAEAAATFEKVTATHPDIEAAHYNLMLAYRSLGRREDAALQKKELDRLQRPQEGEFSDFLKKLGEKAPAQ